MQRVLRPELQAEAARNLLRFQVESDDLSADGNLLIAEHWNSHRRNSTMDTVLDTLKQMAGNRHRCMYCVDSLGSDIEHFWPKASYPNRMYVWENLLLNCTDCGRRKSNKFPLAQNGEPLLIDPSVEDPWGLLDFDPNTGNLSARYFADQDKFSDKGEATIEVLHLDRREGVAQGYLRTYRRLCGLVDRWMTSTLEINYIEQLRETDDHGLLGWFLRGSGKNEPTFLRFHEIYPIEWTRCTQEFP